MFAVSSVQILLPKRLLLPLQAPPPAILIIARIPHPAILLPKSPLIAVVNLIHRRRIACPLLMRRMSREGRIGRAGSSSFAVVGAGPRAAGGAALAVGEAVGCGDEIVGGVDGGGIAVVVLVLGGYAGEVFEVGF
jgi:hypothetical protein